MCSRTIEYTLYTFAATVIFTFSLTFFASIVDHIRVAHLALRNRLCALRTFTLYLVCIPYEVVVVICCC